MNDNLWASACILAAFIGIGLGFTIGVALTSLVNGGVL